MMKYVLIFLVIVVALICIVFFTTQMLHQSDIDECDNEPCTNGATCVEQKKGYKCMCAGGWQGTLCHKGRIYSYF